MLDICKLLKLWWKFLKSNCWLATFYKMNTWIADKKPFLINFKIGKQVVFNKKRTLLPKFKRLLAYCLILQYFLICLVLCVNGWGFIQGYLGTDTVTYFTMIFYCLAKLLKLFFVFLAELPNTRFKRQDRQMGGWIRFIEILCVFILQRGLS